jgi:tetratricopeptide (TPR) repeat protein
VLTSLLVDENLYARGQAIEIFLSMTDCDTFDWFATISTDPSQMSLYGEMYSLLETPLLQNLLANRFHSFPGGSMRCLQLLAFWLSWLRAHFTGETHQLQLHLHILEALKAWDTGVDIEPEESQLARTLLEDFSAAGTCSFGSVEEKSGQLLAGIISSQFQANVPDSDLIEPRFPEHEEVLRQSVDNLPFQLKEKGNHLFTEKKYLQALDCYLQAIDQLPAPGTVADSALLATLHYNCASSYWKLSEQFPLGSASGTANAIFLEALQSLDSLLEACITACHLCLNRDPNYSKARYRCAVALHQRGEVSEAVKILDPQFLHLNLISDPKTLEKLQDLRRAYVAAILVQQKSTVSDLIDERTSRILAQISSRRCQHQVPILGDNLHSDSLPLEQPKKARPSTRPSSSNNRKSGLKYLKKFRGYVSSFHEAGTISSLESSVLTTSLLKVGLGVHRLTSPHLVAQVLNQIWKEDLTLGEVFGAAMDEDMFVCVLLLLHCLQQTQSFEEAEKVGHPTLPARWTDSVVAVDSRDQIMRALCHDKPLGCGRLLNSAEKGSPTSVGFALGEQLMKFRSRVVLIRQSSQHLHDLARDLDRFVDVRVCVCE